MMKTRANADTEEWDIHGRANAEWVSVHAAAAEPKSKKKPKKMSEDDDPEWGGGGRVDRDRQEIIR